MQVPTYLPAYLHVLRRALSVHGFPKQLAEGRISMRDMPVQLQSLPEPKLLPLLFRKTAMRRRKRRLQSLAE